MSTNIEAVTQRDAAAQAREQQVRKATVERNQERAEERQPSPPAKETGRGGSVDRTA